MQNKDIFLNEYIDFLKKENKYNIDTQKIYVKDIREFINFIDKIYFSKKNFTEYLNILKKNNISIKSINRKYFAIKSFLLFMLNKKYIYLLDKIYKPNFTEKSKTKIINNILNKLNINLCNSIFIKDLLIYYLPYKLKISLKQLININIYDIEIKSYFILIKNKKYELNPKIFYLFCKYIDIIKNNNKKLFNVTYQAALSINKHFENKYLNKNLNIKLNNLDNLYQNNNSELKYSEFEVIFKSYKKNHPRS